jgi:LysM repeat protein
MPGDTLAEIAEQFGVDLNDLAQLNGIEDIDVIEVGQILQIPGS